MSIALRVGGGAALFAAAYPPVAHACGPPGCDELVTVLPVENTVPANLPAFVWTPIGRPNAVPVRTSHDVILTELHPAAGRSGVIPLIPRTARILSGEVVLALGTELVPGATYLLWGRDYCAHNQTPPPIATIRAGARAPLPTALGTLRVAPPTVGPLRTATASGACTATVAAAQVQVDLVAHPSAAPWIAALRFETLVDGALWQAEESDGRRAPLGASWRGRGRDLIYAVCATTDPLVARGTSAGAHTVALRASLAGTTTVLATATVPFTLRCRTAP